MEEVLDVYQRPEDPQRPLVCLDELSKQLVKEIRQPRPARPGQPAIEDYEYERNGTANLFMLYAPLLGWRELLVTRQRTRLDWAHCIRDLVDRCFPQAERIVLVLDNLNTHNAASLYQAFPPEEARRLARKLEFHYTPKHGSWLNMAEIEFSVLSRQCLQRRIPDLETLQHEVRAWQARRNSLAVGTDWRFSTDDARIKLKRLYPSILVG